MIFLILSLLTLASACDNPYDGVCDFEGKCSQPGKTIFAFYQSYSASQSTNVPCNDGEEKLVVDAGFMGCNIFCGDRDVASCLATDGTWTGACECPPGTQLVGQGVGDGPERCQHGCDILAHQNAGCCTDDTHPDCCTCNA